MNVAETVTLWIGLWDTYTCQSSISLKTEILQIPYGMCDVSRMLSEVTLLYSAQPCAQLIRWVYVLCVFFFLHLCFCSFISSQWCKKANSSSLIEQRHCKRELSIHVTLHKVLVKIQKLGVLWKTVTQCQSIFSNWFAMWINL